MSLRARQSDRLCTCKAPHEAEDPTASPSPAAAQDTCGCSQPELPSTAPSDVSEGGLAGHWSVTRNAKRRIPRPLLEAVCDAQRRLAVLSEKRGQRDYLQATIPRLTDLLEHADLVARKAAASKAPRRRALGWSRQRKVAPPLRPYAKLRWPPLLVTLARLRGQRNAARLPTVRQSREGEDRSTQPEWECSKTLAFLDQAELFMDKLQVSRNKRRSRRAARGKKSKPADAGPARQLMSRLADCCSVQLREPGKQDKRSCAGARKDHRRKDHRRGLGGSKGPFGIAEFWPYE